MKLRIHDDSLRLRLTSIDISKLVATGCIQNQTVFEPKSVLTYQLRTSRSAANVVASFESGTICVEASQRMIASWAAGDEVGISARQQSDGARSLAILLEKDLGCVDSAKNEVEGR